MGCDYYLRKAGVQMHIGRSAKGWCFALNVGGGGPKDLDGWRALFKDPANLIYDEYGQQISVQDMLAHITERSHSGWEESGWYGYYDEEAFHEAHHSQRGPNGLMRLRIGPDCIAHGDGTYDLVPGEFS